MLLTALTAPSKAVTTRLWIRSTLTHHPEDSKVLFFCTYSMHFYVLN